MKKRFNAVLEYSRRHRFLSAAGAVIIIFFVLFSYRSFFGVQTDTKYILAAVSRGTVISSVSGSGQVSATDNVTLSSKVSGDIVSINVKAGQEVNAGAIIAQIDSSDAYYDYETARLSYLKLTSVDPTDQKNAENVLADAEKNLADDYVNAYSTLNSSYSDMASVMSGLKSLYNCNSGYLNNCRGYKNDEAKAYQNKAESNWYSADRQMLVFTDKYQKLSATSERSEIESVVSEAQKTAVVVAKAAKSAQDAVVWYKDHLSLQGEKTSADAAYNVVNPLVASADSIVSKINTTNNSFVTGKRSVENAKIALTDLVKGSDDLDVRASRLSLNQKGETLANYTIRAPFDGVVASVSVDRGDSISNGTVIAVLITKKNIAEIALNEVDAAKAKVGYKASLAFDALPDVRADGEVIELDSVGTVSQGVVTYTAKVSIDSDNADIKPGMSVSANIVSDERKDVVVVPNSAVKTLNGKSFVQIWNSEVDFSGKKQLTVASKTTPKPVMVSAGVADDTQTEIISGIKDGDIVVIKTINGTASQAAAKTQTAGIFGGGSTRRTSF